MNDELDYKSLFKQCADVLGWSHLVESKILAPRVPTMIRDHLKSLNDRAFENSSDWVSLAAVLDAHCTKAGNENRLAAVMMQKIENLKRNQVSNDNQ